MVPGYPGLGQLSACLGCLGVVPLEGCGQVGCRRPRLTQRWVGLLGAGQRVSVAGWGGLCPLAGSGAISQDNGLSSCLVLPSGPTRKGRVGPVLWVSNSCQLGRPSGQ